jgi:formyltetrahydrofolate deformylase
LVAGISEFIYRHKGNIRHADQHIDAEAGLFLMRVEWDLENFALSRDRIASAFEPLARELGLQWELRFSDQALRTAIFVSKLDHCLYDLLLRHRTGELRTCLSVIVSNHPDCRPIAESFGIEYRVFPVRPENKPEQEDRILEELAKRKIELIVLARYMQVLSVGFVDHYPNRIINIHHSFLPAFVGRQPYLQAYRRGVKLVGATAHYVTAELDSGPIIAQDVIRISHRDSAEDLARKGSDLEKVVLVRAVQLHLENRVLPYGNKTAVFD